MVEISEKVKHAVGIYDVEPESVDLPAEEVDEIEIDG